MTDGTPLYKIKEYREALGWTQEQLAEKCGYSNKTISAYELGKRARIPTLRKIAAALKVAASDLLTDEAKRLMTPSEHITWALDRLRETMDEDDRREVETLLKIAKEKLDLPKIKK